MNEEILWDDLPDEDEEIEKEELWDYGPPDYASYEFLRDPGAGPFDLSQLSDKQRFVIERRYGLHDGERYSQRELALLMGISWQAVAKLEQNALNALAPGVRELLIRFSSSP